MFFYWIADVLTNLWKFLAGLVFWLADQFWPLNLLAPHALTLANFVDSLVGHFRDAGDWLENLIDQLEEFVPRQWVINFVNEIWWLVVDVYEWFLDRWEWLATAIDNWWEEVKPTVIGLIDTALGWLGDRVADVEKTTEWINVQLDELRENLAPYYSPLEWVISFFGSPITTIDEWWTPKKQDIDNTIEALTSPVIDVIDSIQKTIDEVRIFLDNPLEYIKTKVIEPIIEDFNRGFDRGLESKEK